MGKDCAPNFFFHPCIIANVTNQQCASTAVARPSALCRHLRLAELVWRGARVGLTRVYGRGIVAGRDVELCSSVHSYIIRCATLCLSCCTQFPSKNTYNTNCKHVNAKDHTLGNSRHGRNRGDVVS